eukprot:SAG31_NODE_2713_length_5205_cov_2.328241_5_plen_31_part_00
MVTVTLLKLSRHELVGSIYMEILVFIRADT